MEDQASCRDGLSNLDSHLMDFVRWLTLRAGGKIHNGIPKFLDDISCMLRPKTGFLWSRPELADTLNDPASLLGHD